MLCTETNVMPLVVLFVATINCEIPETTARGSWIQKKNSFLLGDINRKRSEDSPWSGLNSRRGRWFSHFVFYTIIIVWLSSQNGMRSAYRSNLDSLCQGPSFLFIPLILSLFTYIQFNSQECMGATGEKGTCVTASECDQKGGTANGLCAGGYGTCCICNEATSLTKYEKLSLLFSVSAMVSCGSTIRENGTYFVNNGYPELYDGSASCQVTILKSNADICQYRYLRFIFETLVIPVHNTGDHDQQTIPSNFVNIKDESLYEYAIKEIVMKFLNKHDLLAGQHYGFRENLGTDNAIIDLTQKLYNSIKIVKPCLTIFLGLAKAFNTISHKKLISKLPFYDFGVQF
ncbi:hypothetical protein NQ317_017668 [Molorchus minor]|uniref:Reverse transcriptase domain-containing protein n=1 Tax=Molorchus minor TaxID=1323400 RepID=A0ABQ9JX90_9CUCU|nr:hypothetical protein NQ317_017668 [Molorchus minor]